MGDDERATVASLKVAREVFKERIEAHSGRLIDTAGDSVLAEFKSVVEAVQCAVEVQDCLSADNISVPEHRKMHFRIGINLGDVIEDDDGTIYGDGVNVAARLEGLASPGGVIVSESAHMQVVDKLDVTLADAGEHEVKNIVRPVKAYRVLLNEPDATTQVQARSIATVLHRPKVIAGIVAVATILIGLAVWGVTVRDEVPQMVTADGTPTDDPLLAMPQGPAVIVLPFDDLDGGDTQTYFDEGLARDITTELTAFRHLRVLDSGTAAAYKGKQADARDIRLEYGVDYVLKGSVQREQTRIRVNMQLLDAENGQSVWAERFDEDLTTESLFAIQDRILESVVTEVAQSNAAISKAELQRARRVPAPDLDAYHCVLRARLAWDLLEPTSHGETRDCLERAVAEYPNYTPAWSRLSFIYLDEHRFGYNPRPEPLRRATEAAHKAIALDANDAGGHLALAHVHFANRNAEAAQLAIKKALSLEPHLAGVLMESANLLSQMGEFDYANELYEKSLAMNPAFSDVVNWTPFRKAMADQDWDAAIEYMTAAEQMAPDFYWHPAALAAVYALSGRIQEGKAKLARALELKPDFADSVRVELGYFNLGPRAAPVPNAAVRGFVMLGLDISDAPIIEVPGALTH
jgi:adenylate cyclase